MKRIILLLVVLCSLPAFTQGTAAIQGFCDLGGAQAKTSGLNSTNYQQGIIPSCQITVYLTGTTTKATIYADGSNTPLSNPFTASALGSVAPGQWIFWTAINQGYDVVMSGGIPPNTYPQSVTLTDVYPGFSFTGSGISLQTNSVPNASQSTLNFSNTTPAAPAGYTNVLWQNSGGNESAYVPALATGPTFQATTTVLGTSMPWDPTLPGNANYQYGNDDGTAAIVVTGITAGQNLNIAWVSGTTGDGNITGISPNGNPPATGSSIGPAGHHFPTVYMAGCQVGTIGLVGAFTDSSGNVVEPLCIGQSSSFVVPPGATQLQLGTNDDPYGPFGGHGANTGSFFVSVTSGFGGVNYFSAPSTSWPSWLVPTVTNPSSAPILTVAASPIPNSALANPSMTVNGTTCTLGSSCTPPTSSFPSGTTNQLLYYAAPGTTVTPLNLGTNLSITGGTLNAAGGGGGSGCTGATANGVCYNNGGTGTYASDVTVDVGGTPNVKVSANTTGVSLTNAQTATVSQLASLTTSNSILQAGSFVRVSDGVSCGDTTVGGGSQKELLECTTITSGSCSAWTVYSCATVSPITPVPMTIPGLTYWYAADQIQAQTNNTGVMHWYNQYTGGIATATSTPGPTYLTSQLNSLPAVSFPGSSVGRMTLQYPVTLQQSTIFVIFNPTSFAAYGDFLSGATGALSLRYNQTTAHLDLEKTFTSTIATDTTTLTAGSWTGATVTYDGLTTGNYAFRVNGSASSSGTNLVSITASTSALAYNQQSASEDFYGSIAEIIVYGRVLTSTEITTVENYLHSKWGVY